MPRKKDVDYKKQVPEKQYKQLNLTMKDAKWLSLGKLNGMSLAQMAEEIYGCSENTLLKNLNQTNNHEIRQIYRIAEAKTLNEGVESLKKQSDGYNYIEKETKCSLRPMAEEYFKEHIEEIEKSVKERDFEEYVHLNIEGMFDLMNGEVKVSEKYAKPDLGATRDLLRVLNSEVWDLESKHKKIPQTKIIVKVENQPQRQREVKPDFVVESK